MSALVHEVAKFREWAELRHRPDYAGPADHGAGEWECDYPEWQSLYAAVDVLLAGAADRVLTDTELELLLYVLARDNEDERVLESLEQYASIARQLAQAAVSCLDIDARWQAAVLAGRISATDVVRQFLDDDAEYVRRRAGFALQETESGERIG
jgi:HEAT repeat protein